MPAIPVHHTAVDSSSPWDAAKVVADNKADLRYCYTWVDGTADANLKGSYKLPHHLKNGGPAILAGVNNAKARAPQMKGVPQGDMAGIEAHLNAHQKDAKQGLLQTIQFFLEQWFGGRDMDDDLNTVDVPTEQAMSMPDIYGNVAIALNPGNASGGDYSLPYKRLIDCYLDGQDVYAIVGQEGKLFKCPVTVSNGGVTLGDMQQVEIDYKPVANQQSFRVLQQADGKTRWFAFPAATAVLNRNGYLNSRELYDNFIKHIEQGEAMPYLTFYHVGEGVKLGQADFVERDGYALLISGLFNDNPLAQCLARSVKDYDGTSIGYTRNPAAMQMIDAGDNVKIPVDTDGILLEVSAMQEIDAACLMTVFCSKEGDKNMNQEALKKLKKLAGNDPAALAEVEKLANSVDQTNQTIEAENLVRQAAAQEAPSNPPAVTEPATTPATGPDEAVTTPITDPAPIPPEFTLTDEAVQAIAEQVRSGFATEMTQSIAAATTTFQTKLDEAVTGLTTTLTGLQSRLDALEQTDQQKVSQALVDMPRSSIPVGYRPRTQTTTTVTPKTEPTSDDVVNETLAKIKAGQVAGKL